MSTQLQKTHAKLAEVIATCDEGTRDRLAPALAELAVLTGPDPYILTLELPEEARHQLLGEALHQGVSSEAIATRAVREYLARKTKDRGDADEGRAS